VSYPPRLSSSRRKLERLRVFQKSLNAGQVQVLAANREIVALTHKRDEIQAKHSGRGTGGYTAICRAGLHLPGCWQMSGSRPRVTLHLARRDAQFFRLLSSNRREPAPFSG